MKVEILSYFVKLAESNSINEAARKLYISQPSLTKALKALEEELGFSLFTRSALGIKLTPEGRAILPEAKQVLAYYEGWITMAHQNRLEEIKIYVGYSFTDFLLPEIIMQFNRKYPEIQFSYEETRYPESYISKDINRPVLSFFSCNGDAWSREMIEKQGNPPLILLKGEFMCLFNRNSSLASHSTICAEHLRSQYLVVPDYKKMKDVRNNVNDLLTLVQPSRMVYGDSLSSVINLARNNPDTYAISFYPALLRFDGVMSGEMTYRPFSGVDTKSDFCLFYSEQAFRTHPLLQEFIILVQKCYQEFTEKNGVSQ